MPTIIFEGKEVKVACGACIKGHRSNKCIHIGRLLIEVRKPGRPLTSCPHDEDCQGNCSQQPAFKIVGKSDDSRCENPSDVIDDAVKSDKKVEYPKTTRKQQQRLRQKLKEMKPNHSPDPEAAPHCIKELAGPSKGEYNSTGSAEYRPVTVGPLRPSCCTGSKSAQTVQQDLPSHGIFTQQVRPDGHLETGSPHGDCATNDLPWIQEWPRADTAGPSKLEARPEVRQRTCCSHFQPSLGPITINTPSATSDNKSNPTSSFFSPSSVQVYQSQIVPQASPTYNPMLQSNGSFSTVYQHSRNFSNGDQQISGSTNQLMHQYFTLPPMPFELASTLPPDTLNTVQETMFELSQGQGACTCDDALCSCLACSVHPWNPTTTDFVMQTIREVMTPDAENEFERTLSIDSGNFSGEPSEPYIGITQEDDYSGQLPLPSGITQNSDFNNAAVYESIPYPGWDLEQPQYHYNNGTG